MDELTILMRPDGTSRCVYSEAFDLAALGRLHIARGSQVEPTAAGGWTADLSPVGGPRLGPFARRSDALAAERAWLDRHWVTRADGVPAIEPVAATPRRGLAGADAELDALRRAG